MRKWLWIPCVVVLLVGVAAVAWPSPEGKGKCRRFWDIEKLVEKLGLTGEQIAKLEEVEYNFEKANIDLTARIKSARLTLEHLLLQERTDKEQLDKLVDEIGAARKEQVELSLQRLISVRNVLSADQWKQAEKALKRLARQGREGRQEGRGPHPRGEKAPQVPPPPLPEEAAK